MSRLFGIPVGELTFVLATLLCLAVCVLLGLGLRNRIFLRLGIRNVRRRRARSALIVTGLMLGTTIIAAALATGDTVSRTIRSSATAALGQTDGRGRRRSRCGGGARRAERSYRRALLP